MKISGMIIAPIVGLVIFISGFVCCCGLTIVLALWGDNIDQETGE